LTLTVDKLKEVGYWDPHNVTEDADLGIRLYLHGYKVHLINSTTLEEAPHSVFVWLAQRIRWIKGFIQTLCVFSKAKKDYSKFGFLNAIIVYIFIGLATYSFFCAPWLMLVFIFNINDYVYYLWLINSIIAISYMYIAVSCIFMQKRSIIHKLLFIDWLVLMLWPIYFILHSVASHLAICEIIIAPFRWNKTPHGKDIESLQVIK